LHPIQRAERVQRRKLAAVGFVNADLNLTPQLFELPPVKLVLFFEEVARGRDDAL
jgi:hypothetical protein